MIVTDNHIYRADNQVCEGFITYDNASPKKRPGVLIAHTFRGQSEFEVEKSVELAKLGYVGFAIDLFGQGRRASTPEEANLLMQELDSDRQLLRSRILAALQTLSEHKMVDANNIGAIGFCFGGKCVLDLARSGADIKGVVSFHGIYDQPNIDYTSPIPASVLVLHGWEDPLALPDSMTALAKELTRRNADWQILAFGQTGHAFTNPNIHDKAGGLFYQVKSNRRAWLAMKNFFKELFN